MPVYWEVKDQVFGALNEQTFELVFAVNTFGVFFENFEAFIENVAISQQKDCFNDKWACLNANHSQSELLYFIE